MEKVILELQNKANNCSTRNKEYRAMKGAYVDAIITIKHALSKRSPTVPRIVCYCGSLRFKKLFEKYEYESIYKGEIALMPCCMFVDIEREYGALSDYKQKADEQHRRKIDICDELFVINENGYIGESTKSEIEYALKIGKPVNYMEN